MNFKWKGFLLAMVLTPLASGCTSLLAPINGVPVSSIPKPLLGEKRADYINVPLALLRMEQPEHYLLDDGDILGIYIEGVMPASANEDQPVAIPPVHFPEAGSDLPPSVGFPIPVRDDGTLPLPLISPIDVRGKTMAEVEELIRKAYVDDEKILRQGRDRILVSLMRERTSRVIVIREDGGTDGSAIAGGSRQFGNAQEVISGTERQGSGFTLDMPAYKNDLMHALADTGGLPGLNAMSEVKVLKASRFTEDRREEMMMQIFAGQGENCGCCIDFCGNQMEGMEGMVEDPFSITIPLRVRPGEMPNIDPADVILEDGDIVYIEARDTEVFYTGGLLPGGQYPLPRDYDLDVIGAMAVAGTGLGGSSSTGGGSSGAGMLLSGGFGGATPTQLFVMRKGPCGQDFTISVDLKNAYNDSSQRILVQPGDTLILRYKPCEEALNFGLVTFFTFGIRELFK
ncbi:Polysaccharide biosynthesis/export protein [Planctomycetes bacterium CA13]|uniref:Polysaccharide biosynthesis/export protein n=1 Tax=Novipirellula herctigrandis TaxID=2527986 RepID=A0A5C5Z4H9_9BACT|nr:Polysaccharide biosynthesis/export protein [Planctomycetes bacterium CA13]